MVDGCFTMSSISKTVRCCGAFLISGVIVLGITGCSGHPGAGNWDADSSSSNEYQRLEITFDGTGELVPKESQVSVLRCVWQASSAETIGIKCKSSDASVADVEFEMTIENSALGESNKATLVSSNRVVAKFVRAPFTKKSFGQE